MPCLILGTAFGYTLYVLPALVLWPVSYDGVTWWLCFGWGKAP